MKTRSIFLIAFLLVTPYLGFAQNQELISKAEKEGEVILYATMSVADFAHLAKAFKEKYPRINLRHISLPSSRQTARVMQEFRAGAVQADVLGNSPDALLYLKQQGVVGQYRSPEAKNLFQGSWDSDGFWFGITTDLLVTGFNPRLLSKAAVPKSYDDYLRPQMKGQLALNRGVPYPLTGMVSLRGEEQGIAYFKRLSQQDLRLIGDFNHMVNLMAARRIFPYRFHAGLQTRRHEAQRSAGGLGGSAADIGDDCQHRHGEKPAASGRSAVIDRFLSFGRRPTRLGSRRKDPAA